MDTTHSEQSNGEQDSSPSQNKTLEEVNKIIGHLQEGKWSDHSPQKLISAQGKLASLLGNVIGLKTEARSIFDQWEIHTKNKEAENMLKHRKEGKTIDESKNTARIDVLNDMFKVSEARKLYEDYRGIVDTMQTLIVACQVTIRSMRDDLSSSKYKENQ